MYSAYRKTIIAGNWKMNKTPDETVAFVQQFKSLLSGKESCEIIICTPAIDLTTAVNGFVGSNVAVGAENLYCEPYGAYTGEISAEMLVNAGVKYVIIGHSERRSLFGEMDALINKKVRAALSVGLKPILCVGESLEQREQNVAMEFIARQLKSDLYGISADNIKNCIIAYEPIWAIGTGKTASGEQAAMACSFIRRTLTSLCGEDVARGVSILYGGSIKSENAAEILSHKDIDGGLIGGASLSPESFFAIVNVAQ